MQKSLPRDVKSHVERFYTVVDRVVCLYIYLYITSSFSYYTQDCSNVHYIPSIYNYWLKLQLPHLIDYAQYKDKSFMHSFVS